MIGAPQGITHARPHLELIFGTPSAAQLHAAARVRRGPKGAVGWSTSVMFLATGWPQSSPRRSPGRRLAAARRSSSECIRYFVLYDGTEDRPAGSTATYAELDMATQKCCLPASDEVSLLCRGLQQQPVLCDRISTVGPWEIEWQHRLLNCK